MQAQRTHRPDLSLCLIPTRWPKLIGNLPFKTVQLGPWNWISGHSAKNSSSNPGALPRLRGRGDQGDTVCLVCTLYGRMRHRVAAHTKEIPISRSKILNP